MLKDLFLPWYNAYRFLVQNVRRVENETGVAFNPRAPGQEPVNVLDRWIASATSSLVTFVRSEMEGYRLYTVVPRLVNFIGQLTNVYVRYNRSRLKGKLGDDDTRRALAALYDVLLVLCKTMAPFTPFFVEKMYQNLKRCLPDGDLRAQHVHRVPGRAIGSGGRARRGVPPTRMQTVIETGRVIRERNNKPLKTPLRRLVVAHDDQDFLSDLQGELRAYVVEELNVLDMETCADPLKYATIKAEPNCGAGQETGQSHGRHAQSRQGHVRRGRAGVPKSGAFVVGDVTLGPEDILVKREFALPEGVTAEEMDAATGENEVMVIMDVVVDQGLLDLRERAREFVNRLQKLRKSSGLQATDAVEVFFELKAGGDGATAEGMVRMLESEKAYLRESLGCDPKPPPPWRATRGCGDGRVLALHRRRVRRDVSRAKDVIRLRRCRRSNAHALFTSL